MKRVLLLTVSLLLCAALFTLKAEKPSDSVIRIDGGGVRFDYSWEIPPDEAHWAGLSFSFINLKGLPEDVYLNQGRSYSIEWRVTDWEFPFSSHWLVGSGFGFDWSRYHFKGNMGVREVDNVTRFVPAADGVRYTDSKLLTYYLTVPFFLEYQVSTIKGRSFFVNAGPVAYIKLFSKSQVERVTTDGGTRKEVLGRGLNILPVNMRLMAQVGFGHFYLYGSYAPISLFASGEGPEVSPWNLGVVWGF